jgi:hypothetical protein
MSENNKEKYTKELHRAKLIITFCNVFSSTEPEEKEQKGILQILNTRTTPNREIRLEFRRENNCLPAIWAARMTTKVLYLNISKFFDNTRNFFAKNENYCFQMNRLN